MYFYCKYFGLLKDLFGKAILHLQYMHVTIKKKQQKKQNDWPGINSQSDTIIYYSKQVDNTLYRH